MSLSDKRTPWTVNHHGWLYQEEDVKEFIKQIEFWAHIDLGKQTLTIDYDKFKELAGKDLTEKTEKEVKDGKDKI